MIKTLIIIMLFFNISIYANNDINSIDSEIILSLKDSDNNIRFDKCIVCHSGKFDRLSMTQKRKVNSLNFKELKSVIHKYQNNKQFGGKMKIVMQAMVKNYSNKDIYNLYLFIQGRNNDKYNKH